jgi:hypothetical protein
MYRYSAAVRGLEALTSSVPNEIVVMITQFMRYHKTGRVWKSWNISWEQSERFVALHVKNCVMDVKKTEELALCVPVLIILSC